MVYEYGIIIGICGIYLQDTRLVAKAPLATPAAIPVRLPTTCLVVGVDLDDTLWPTSHLYQAGAEKLGEALSDYATPDEVAAAVEEVHAANVPVNGYGAKAYQKSLLGAAQRIAGKPDRSTRKLIKTVCARIREDPATPSDGVPEALEAMSATGVRLVAVTKGEHREQSKKLKRSGLADKFERLFVLKQKNAAKYLSVMKETGTPAGSYVQIGDSITSDVLPVIEAGGRAILVAPDEPCWEDSDLMLPQGVPTVGNLMDTCGWLRRWNKNGQQPEHHSAAQHYTPPTPQRTTKPRKQRNNDKQIRAMKRTRRYTNQEIADHFDDVEVWHVNRVTRGMPRKLPQNNHR